MYEAILYETNAGVATIALNRPEKLNAFDGRMHEELHAALDDAAADDGVRCLVLRGEGRGFSAGADLKCEDLSRRGPGPRRIPPQDLQPDGHEDRYDGEARGRFAARFGLRRGGRSRPRL